MKRLAYKCKYVPLNRAYSQTIERHTLYFRTIQAMVTKDDSHINSTFINILKLWANRQLKIKIIEKETKTLMQGYKNDRENNSRGLKASKIKQYRPVSVIFSYYLTHRDLSRLGKYITESSIQTITIAPFVVLRNSTTSTDGTRRSASVSNVFHDTKKLLDEATKRNEHSKPNKCTFKRFTISDYLGEIHFPSFLNGTIF